MIVSLAFFILGPFLFWIVRSSLGENKKVNTVSKKIGLKIYISIILFYFFTLFAGNHNYYIKGYRSTSILFITMAIVGTIYWLIDRREVFDQILRVILFGFSIMLTGFSFFLIIELLGDYKNQLIYNDKTYRLEDTRRGIGEPCMLPALFVKENFYEQKFHPTDSSLSLCLSKPDILSVIIKPLANNQISVLYLLSTEKIKDIPSPLEITYSKD